MSSLRVLTLNLNVHLPSGEASDAVVRAAVADERPDLICFQEALWWGDDETSALHQAEPILAGLGYHHVHQFEVQGTVDSNPAGLTYGTVIASRWPIVRSDTAALPSTARGEGFPRAIQAAEIEVPAPVGRLLLVNPKPHYEPHMELEREMEAVALADYVCVACSAPPSWYRHMFSPRAQPAARRPGCFPAHRGERFRRDDRLLVHAIPHRSPVAGWPFCPLCRCLAGGWQHRARLHAQ